MSGELTLSTSDVAPAPERLRVMIVDPSRSFSSHLRRLLAETLPAVEVTEYDPEDAGRPGAEFDWSAYDALLLDVDLGLEDTGLAWLEAYRDRPGFPPAILLADAGDDYAAARAIKLGAHDYLRKQDASAERLGAIVTQAVAEARRRQVLDATLAVDRTEPHLDILQRLRRPGSKPPGDGDSIGYRFVRLIGQGASSRVYLAERSTDASTLVLKVIDVTSVHDPQLVERFVREAEIVSEIDSRYVVRYYDYGLTQTYGYIAMEFFTRGDLKQRMERGVPVNDALNYVRHIAHGLAAIHARQIIHRDLKPGNIMFRADDSLALADFGISRRMDLASDLTNQGSVLGTPNYLSPEQALGQPVDPRADLYSAGVILFEMLAGHKPFHAETASALVYQHVHADVPKLPAELGIFQPLIEQLLAKRPEDRLPDAAALIEAIGRLQRSLGR